MPDFTIGQGDRKPDLTFQLLENGAAMNLASATNVTLKALKADGTTGFSGTCTLTSASLGKGKYTFASGDTDEPGVYRVVFVVDSGLSTQQTVPTARTSTIHVTASNTADT